jgi:hypothetical protein
MRDGPTRSPFVTALAVLGMLALGAAAGWTVRIIAVQGGSSFAAQALAAVFGLALAIYAARALWRWRSASRRRPSVDLAASLETLHALQTEARKQAVKTSATPAAPPASPPPRPPA